MLLTAHDPSSVKHGGAVWWHEHAWLPVALGYWCLLMTWQRTEVARIILKCMGIYCLPRFSQMQQQLMRQRFIVQVDAWPKTYYKNNPGVLKVKKWNILQWPCQSSDFNPIWGMHFNLLKTKAWQKHQKGGGTQSFGDVKDAKGFPTKY